MIYSQTDAGSKHEDRGDSAVSKGTTDSGVVVENRDITVIPGEIPEKLPPLSSESFTTSNTEEVKKESKYWPLKKKHYNIQTSSQPKEKMTTSFLLSSWCSSFTAAGWAG